MRSRTARVADQRMRYPTTADLFKRARRRLPYFADDFLHGGTGDELASARNISALQAIQIVPRYGLPAIQIDTTAQLFGRSYAAPIVLAPVGMDGAIWPGATRLLAEAARDNHLPYMTGTLATLSMEQVAQIAPDSFWFQLYSFPAEDHKVTYDLVRRADAAGAHVLAVTIDAPIASRRVRDMRNRLTLPMRISLPMISSAAARPAWLSALMREGLPHLANLAPYCRPGAGRGEINKVVRNSGVGSNITWEVIDRIRQMWHRPLLVKGIQHPADADIARSIGVDGIVVSNHGGRQFDPAPAPIAVLPAIRSALGREIPIMVDGGITSGTDVLKAIACGANAVLVGRAFLAGLAALGGDGAAQVAEMLIEELRIAMAQAGMRTISSTIDLSVKHPHAWLLSDFSMKTTSPK